VLAAAYSDHTLQEPLLQLLLLLLLQVTAELQARKLEQMDVQQAAVLLLVLHGQVLVLRLGLLWVAVLVLLVLWLVLTLMML
jgi:lysylphosphatidylglycerol synthetase-like protein (DUF2156 family)